MTARTNARGAGLAEAVLAMLLAALITSAALVTLGRVIRTTATVATRGERLDAGRTVVAVLRSDLSGLAAPDFAAASDSVRLRVFRGLAVPCDTTDGRLLVRYHGARAPDPEKDSVLLFGQDGETTLALDASATGESTACDDAAAGELLRWTLSGAADVVPVALLFETGTYVFRDGALRYRRGGGGRQPITAPAFRTGSGFTATGDAIEVALPADGTPVSGAAAASLRIELRNQEGGGR